LTNKVLAYPSRSVWGDNSVLKRKLERSSVEKDVKQFCGWDTMNKIVECAQAVGSYPLRDAGFVATTFECGARVTEALLSKPTMFSVVKGCVPKLILVENMPLLKRYKKLSDFLDELGHKRYKTEKVNATRDLSFRVDEPLVRPMILWVTHAIENKYEWLFPSPYKTGEPLSRKWAYQLIQRIGVKLNMNLYPHRLRAERASQLAVEYDFREASLLEWFQWQRWETAKKYAKFGPLGLAKKMGVKFRKDRGLKPGDLEKLKID